MQTWMLVSGGSLHVTAILLALTSTFVDGGQTCATCAELESGRACHAHTVCGGDEVCHAFIYKDDLGQLFKDYGCAVPGICQHYANPVLVGRSNSVHHGLCNVCCNDTALCNEELSCPSTSSTAPPATLPMECSELSLDDKENGTYTIYPYGSLQLPVNVYCEFDYAGNAWTVIQRRYNACVNFTRGWNSYKHGFGSADDQYWLGNDIIHQLTSRVHTSLRVVLTDFEGRSKDAIYDTFHLGDEANGYTLFVQGFAGPAGDSLTLHSGRKFTTLDHDNDGYLAGNCAQLHGGGWWYYHCGYSDLNGEYLAGYHTVSAHGVFWYNWRGYTYSYKTSTMMIRGI